MEKRITKENLKGKEVKMMKKVIGFVFVLLCMAGAAYAAPINIPNDEPLYFQFNNLEQVDQSLTNSITVPGGYGTSGQWGLFNLSLYSTRWSLYTSH